MPLILDPSFTSTNANVFCFRTVRTQPLMDTCSSDTLASSVFTQRGETLLLVVLVASAGLASVLDICNWWALLPGILLPFANSEDTKDDDILPSSELLYDDATDTVLPFKVDSALVPAATLLKLPPPNADTPLEELVATAAAKHARAAILFVQFL